MKSTSIGVKVGVTKNMGNYESLRIDYEMKVHLDPEDKPSEAIEEARNYLFQKLKTDLINADGGKTWLR